MKKLGEEFYLLSYDDDMSYTPFVNAFAEMVGIIYPWWASSMLHTLYWRQALLLTNFLFLSIFFYLIAFLNSLSRIILMLTYVALIELHCILQTRPQNS